MTSARSKTGSKREIMIVELLVVVIDDVVRREQGSIFQNREWMRTPGTTPNSIRLDRHARSRFPLPFHVPDSSPLALSFLPSID